MSGEPRDEQGRWTDGGGDGSDSYSSSPPSSREKDKHVAAVYKPTGAAVTAAKKAGRTPLEFHQLTADGNQRFHDAIIKAKENLKFGASVHAYDAADYRGMKTYVTPDDKAGFALKPDGDIVSAFSQSKAKRAGDSILALAVQHGGRKLDAFDTVLPAIYSDNGFRAVARIPWNEEYKPADWDKNTFKKFNGGKPDVVFMVHDPANAAPYKPGDGKRVSSYEEGVAEQDKALKEIEKGREHPGKGYSQNAYVDHQGVIHTSNVYDAQRALFEDRKVELTQVKQISTLIKRLGETAAEMAEHGETAPTFNLCNVSVKGTNLFCADQIGIPRVEMPVIRAGKTKDFIKHLKKLGYKIEETKEEARNLRATQNEISGTKVAAAMARIKQEGFYKRLVVSRDDYILDGHHTWAGQLGLDAKDGDLEDDGREVKIARVDISITKLLEEAEKWTGGAGKKPASEAPKGYQFVTLREAQRLLDVTTYQKFVLIAGQFLTANGHLARGIENIRITVPIAREFDDALHPHQPAGQGGGQFAPTGGSDKPAAPKKPAASPAAAAEPAQLQPEPPGYGLSPAEHDKLDDWTMGEPKSAAYSKMRKDPKMIAIMAKLPKYEGTVYRGTSFYKGKIGSIKVGSIEDIIGKTFDISKLSSSSTDGAKAAEFAVNDVLSPTTGELKKGYTAVVFKMDQMSGHQVPSDIDRGVEKEVVLMPHTTFQAINVADMTEATNGVKYKEVTMREV